MCAHLSDCIVEIHHCWCRIVTRATQLQRNFRLTVLCNFLSLSLSLSLFKCAAIHTFPMLCTPVGMLCSERHCLNLLFARVCVRGVGGLVMGNWSSVLIIRAAAAEVIAVVVLVWYTV